MLANELKNYPEMGEFMRPLRSAKKGRRSYAEPRRFSAGIDDGAGSGVGDCHFSARSSRGAPILAVLIAIKVEHVEQVADCRHVRGHVGIGAAHLGIGEIVAAAMGQRLEAPIALYELNHRGMIVIAVHDLAAAREGRDDNQRNARTIAKEIERLEEPRIPVPPALVKGDDESGPLEEFRVG